MAERPVALKKPAPAAELDPSSLYDTHPEVRLDFKHVRKALKQGYTRPFLLVDTGIVRTKVRRFKAAMPRVHPHYAVKANPDPRVLKVLIEEGTGFEIASIAELDLLLELGVPAAEVFYSNPMKSRAYIEYAASKGVEWYVLDSVEELRKIHSIKPDARLYVRRSVPSSGSALQ
jgi:ornithine decarboxylase